MELFTVMIGLIRQVFSVAMYSKKETGNLCCTYNDLIQLHFTLLCVFPSFQQGCIQRDIYRVLAD